MSSSSYRPLIAVVAYQLGPDRVARWPDGGYGVPAPYIEALRRADARTAILSPGERGTPEKLLDPFDGLVLVGGGDVDPSRYGQEPGDHVYGVEPARDAFEIELLLAAERIEMPALCICRGMQVMNVAHRGTLKQHLPDLPELIEHGVPLAGTQTMHAVEPSAGSRLIATTGVDSLACSSHHHQGIDRLGDGLIVSGTSPDGLIEAIEWTGAEPGKGWVLGIQWHPEDTADKDAAQQSLFDGLVTLAKWRGSRAGAGETHGRTRDIGLVDHDPDWAARFEQEKSAIVGALGERAIRVDHIGSTSVQGLAAKPVIDIQVSVHTLVPREPFVGPLTEIGYVFVGDPHNPAHEFLTKGYADAPSGAQRFHLHVCEADGEWEARHLAFRDRLRSSPQDAAAYERLKRELAQQHPNDIYSYTDAKAGFISSHEAPAGPD